MLKATSGLESMLAEQHHLHRLTKPVQAMNPV